MVAVHKIRKIIFFVLTAIYIVVCPLLILYALGYIYNPVRQRFVQTGIIRLASMPSGADVFLETSRYKNQTPATISGVLPGEYRITLRKRGYKPWSHSIMVEGGKAAAFDNILLIPDLWPTKELAQAEYEQLIPLTNRYLFFVAESSNLGSYYAFAEKNKLLPLLNSTSPFFDASAAKVYYTAKSGAMVIEDGSFWNRKYLYVDIEKLPGEANDITAFFEGRPDFVKWDAQDPTKLYAGHSGCINLIDVKARKAYPCYLKDVKGFGVYDGDIYILDANSTFWQMSGDKKERKILSEDLHLGKQLFGRSDFYEIFPAVRDIILFLGADGDLIAQRPPYHISDKGILGFEFGPDQNLLLYWSKKSVGLADFSSPNQKDVFRTAFTAQNLYTKASSIRQCFWAYKDSHILFNDDDRLYVMELEPQGQPHIEPVTNIRKGTDVRYAAETGIVYYLDADSAMLKECRIMPTEAMPMLGFKIQD